MYRRIALSLFALVVLLTQYAPSEACHRRWRNQSCCQPVCQVPYRAEAQCWCLYYQDTTGNDVLHGCYRTKIEAKAAATLLGCTNTLVYERVWDPKCCCWRWCVTVVTCSSAEAIGKTCKIIQEDCPEDKKK